MAKTGRVAAAGSNERYQRFGSPSVGSPSGTQGIFARSFGVAWPAPEGFEPTLGEAHSRVMRPAPSPSICSCPR